MRGLVFEHFIAYKMTTPELDAEETTLCHPCYLESIPDRTCVGVVTMLLICHASVVPQSCS